MVRIKSIGVLQTAIVLSVFYCLGSLPFALIIAIGTLLSGHLFGAVYALFLPLVYLVLGFLFTAAFCFIYNLVADYFGGIEIELEGTGIQTEVRS